MPTLRFVKQNESRFDKNKLGLYGVDKDVSIRGTSMILNFN